MHILPRQMHLEVKVLKITEENITNQCGSEDNIQWENDFITEIHPMTNWLFQTRGL